MLNWLFGGNDHGLAEGRYSGRESASDRAARKAAEASARRSYRHKHGGADKAARRGQAWTDRQRY